MISNCSLFKYQGIINLNISLNFVFINSELANCFKYKNSPSNANIISANLRWYLIRLIHFTIPYCIYIYHNSIHISFSFSYSHNHKYKINPRRDSWIISQFPSTRSLNFAPPTTLTCLYFNSFMAVAFYTHPHPRKRITSEQITKRHFVALKIKPRRGLRPRIFLSPLLC